MPLYQEENVENEEKLKLAQVFFSGDKAHVWDKRGVEGDKTVVRLA